MPEPRVSIILPVYNGERFIRRAIESVQAQTFSAWELLVINDGSTDASAATAEALAAADPRIRVFSQENRGIQKALNHALREARGEYIARIDDDDVWLDAGKLAAQVEFLDTHTDHLLLGTGAVVRDEAGRELFRYQPPVSDILLRSRMLFRNCFVHSSVMFRAAAARAADGYPESAETLHVEDYALWLALGTQGKLANLAAYATGFTLRAGAISSRNKSAQFRRNQALIRRYRRAYPRYTLARLAGAMRSGIYSFFRLLPKSMRSLVLRFYKES